MSEALDRATETLVEDDLSYIVLDKEELPDDLWDLEVAREGVLDNATMAAHGFSGSTTGDTRGTGRINGFIREFARAEEPDTLGPGTDVVAASVVHLFDEARQVSRWMTDRFLGEFRRVVGKDLRPGQHLMSADQLKFEGFSDEAIGLRTLQATNSGLVSSTIVDFRVGRLLGVAYLVSLGDVTRRELVARIGIALERRMVKVLLGAI